MTSMRTLTSEDGMYKQYQEHYSLLILLQREPH